MGDCLVENCLPPDETTTTEIPDDDNVSTTEMPDDDDCCILECLKQCPNEDEYDCLKDCLVEQCLPPDDDDNVTTTEQPDDETTTEEPPCPPPYPGDKACRVCETVCSPCQACGD